MQAYEIVEFIASSSPQNVIAFRPSEEAQARVTDLIFREKTEGLLEEERSELDHHMQIEHLMRLAKARPFRTDQNTTTRTVRIITRRAN